MIERGKERGGDQHGEHSVRLDWERSDRKEDEEKSLKASGSFKTAPVSKSETASGISDESLTQVAQQKYDAQEEKFRDVAKAASALIRDYQNLKTPEFVKKVNEIRKALLKYDLQYLRVFDCQQRRRNVEIEKLKAQAIQCRLDAQKETDMSIELLAIVEKERRRRKRYASYESIATEVNKKKSRAECKTEIEATQAAIAKAGCAVSFEEWALLKMAMGGEEPMAVS